MNILLLELQRRVHSAYFRTEKLQVGVRRQAQIEAGFEKVEKRAVTVPHVERVVGGQRHAHANLANVEEILQDRRLESTRR